MLDSALAFLADEVNVYLKKNTDAVLALEVGNIADHHGKWAFTGMRIALVNVEEERVVRSQLPERVVVDGKQMVLQPDLKLNLVVLVAANNNDYKTSLHYLSHVITFFQSHRFFSPAEYPGLDTRIDRLAVEMLTYGPEQLNQLWAYVGAKYLPSAVYRIRMLALQNQEPTGVEQPITAIDLAVHDR